MLDRSCKIVKFQFNSIKTTQAACHLLKRKGAGMSKGVLIKMLYLADRELLARRGHPLTGDQPVSMKNGPVLSITYDLTKGDALSHRAYWEQHITNSPRGSMSISPKKPCEIDRLSKAEVRVLDEVFDRFKDYTWTQLVEYCHSLPEWRNPGESSARIEFRTILLSLHKTSEEIAEIENQTVESEILDALLTNHAAN